MSGVYEANITVFLLADTMEDATQMHDAVAHQIEAVEGARFASSTVAPADGGPPTEKDEQDMRRLADEHGWP